MRLKKTIYIVIVLIFVFMLSLNPSHLSDRFSHSENMPLHNISKQEIVASEIYPSMSIRLTSSLKPINGYSYGNFGVPTTFYASVINGIGTYTYRWFVNSTLVSTTISRVNVSSLTWTFTNPSEFFGGLYDYINVTVTDTSNQSSSASYYGTFWYEPEIFVGVSGNDAVDTPGAMNITVTDWLDVSPLSLTLFVNGKTIYETMTAGWGAGFPISIKYNFTGTGVYNITAVAYDDSGQRIAVNSSINVISHLAYDWYVLYHAFMNDGTIIFLVILFLFLGDVSVTIRSKKSSRKRKY